MSTFYAAFPDSETALRAATNLLQEGILSDDISLLSHLAFGDLHLGVPAIQQLPPLQDASSFVGAPDDPEDRPVRRSRLPQDYLEESPIGGGIATSKPDDDISKVDEADDSQELADEQSSPVRTQADREVMDLERAIITGFPTDVPRIDGFRSRRQPDENFDKGLESIIVPDFGVVLGGGELATAALTLGNDKDDLIPLIEHFTEAGVDEPTAERLLQAFADGGAVLSVELASGSNEAIRLEEWAERIGATIVLTAGGPRFHVFDQLAD